MGWIIAAMIAAMIVAITVVLTIVRFTKVEEGTAKAIMLFGSFLGIIFRWRGHWMDENYSVWKEDEEGGEQVKQFPGRIIGGLWVYFWPFQKIHRYKHRWTDIVLREDGKLDVKLQEEILKHVLLRPAVYSIKLFQVETKPPERWPVDVLTLVTLRIQNPYLFLFVAPPTPIEDVLARIGAEIRATVTSHKLDDLLKVRAKSLWAEKEKEKALLKGVKVIEETLQKWGMKLADKGIEIRSIDLPPTYQQAAAAKREEELKAAARAEEIMGTVISSVARASGRPEKKVQAEFQVDPEAFYKKHEKTVNNVMTRLSMEESSYLKIDRPEGLDPLDLIAAWQRMPRGKEASGEANASVSDSDSSSEQENSQDKKSERFWSEKRPMERIHRRRRQ